MLFQTVLRRWVMTFILKHKNVPGIMVFCGILNLKTNGNSGIRTKNILMDWKSRGVGIPVHGEKQRERSDGLLLAGEVGHGLEMRRGGGYTCVLRRAARARRRSSPRRRGWTWAGSACPAPRSCSWCRPGTAPPGSPGPGTPAPTGSSPAPAYVRRRSMHLGLVTHLQHMWKEILFFFTHIGHGSGQACFIVEISWIWLP